MQLLTHQLALMIKLALLVLSLLNLLEQLLVTLLVDLVNDLPKHVIVIRLIKVDTLSESVAHLAVNEARHEWIGQCWPVPLLRITLIWGLEVDGRGG